MNTTTAQWLCTIPTLSGWTKRAGDVPALAREVLSLMIFRRWV